MAAYLEFWSNRFAFCSCFFKVVEGCKVARLLLVACVCDCCIFSVIFCLLLFLSGFSLFRAQLDHFSSLLVTQCSREVMSKDCVMDASSPIFNLQDVLLK